MAKRLLQTLVNNLGFKILAVVLAFILWLVVYNTDDPTKTRTYTANVTIENASSVTEMNKCFDVLDGTNTVSFAVSGKRSELDKLDDTDFTATADMSRMIVNEDGETASVPIEITAKRSYSSVTISSKNKYLEISLEDLMSRRFMITANTRGDVADGYALGDVSVTNPNVLSISGPASIVKTVDTVVATIDVDGMSSSLSEDVLPVLYDEDGQEVDTTRLTLSNTTVTISARILSVIEVPLSFSTTGTPYGDYRVVEISSSPSAVQLKGSSEVLNPIVSLEIPASLIDVSGVTEDVRTTIDITQYLPSGVELVDSSDASVTVTVRIEAYKSKTFGLPTEQISVQGLSDGLTLSYELTQIPVLISGLQDDLNDLTVDDLIASVDVTDLAAGEHQVELVLTIDEEHYAYQPMTISITLAEEGAEDDSETTTDTDEGDSDEETQ